MQLEVVEGDITELEVDAIANAANDHLWMGAGVAGAIKRAGGDEIEREAVAKGPIAVGDAVATGAGSARRRARHPRRRHGPGPAHRAPSSIARTTTRAASRSPTSSAHARSRCRRSAPGVGGFSAATSARAIMVGVARAYEPADARARRLRRLRPRGGGGVQRGARWVGGYHPSRHGASGIRARGSSAQAARRRVSQELTRVTNKHLLPVGRWPMVYYPLQLLQLARHPRGAARHRPAARR